MTGEQIRAKIKRLEEAYGRIAPTAHTGGYGDGGAYARMRRICDKIADLRSRLPGKPAIGGEGE